MKIETKAVDLYRIMSDAMQFASPAIGVPAIESVRIESSPNDAETVNLIGVATDRFVLGVSRVVGNGDSGIGFTLSTTDVKNVLKIAKTVRRDESWRLVTIETTDAETMPDRGRITFTFTSGETITVNAIDADFPKWRQLLAPDTDAMARPAVGLGVDPLKLAQFARVAAAKGSPMQLFPGIAEDGRLKPVHVRIGDDFYGLVMPVRAPGAQLFTYETPAWLS